MCDEFLSLRTGQFDPIRAHSGHRRWYRQRLGCQGQARKPDL